MKIRQLINLLKMYENQDCDVRVAINEDNFFNNSTITSDFDNDTKSKIQEHLSLPNFWINDFDFNTHDEENSEIVLWGKYE
jgi:hypothetical protein|tara:strand:- start:1 stop:243 length:243 start_codon:yes stop_codon:yes gene_type:complete